MDPFHHLPTLSPRGAYILTSLGTAVTVLTLNAATGTRPNFCGNGLQNDLCGLGSINFQTHDTTKLKILEKKAVASLRHQSPCGNDV